MADFFHDKVALVTGAASGIGRASALAFANAGAKVAVVDLQEKAGNETVDLIKKDGGDAIFIKANVSNADNVEAMVDGTIKAYGSLDFAHNNAGIEPPLAKTAEVQEADWDKIVNINLKSVWLCMKYEIIQMLKQDHGSIVNTASVVSILGQPDMSSYVACKHAVLGLTKTAALEYAENNIRVNAVCPAIVSTPMLDRFTGGDKELTAKLTAEYPIKRLVSTEEVADAVLWLCSNKASYVNGHSLMIDGGFSIK